MNIEFLTAAEEELAAAAEYYECQQTGLGARLTALADECRHYIQQHPEVPPLRRNLYRRVNLLTFPYYFAYLIHDDTIWVLTFAHTARRPEYWLGRAGRWGR